MSLLTPGLKDDAPFVYRNPFPEDGSRFTDFMQIHITYSNCLQKDPSLTSFLSQKVLWVHADLTLLFFECLLLNPEWRRQQFYCFMSQYSQVFFDFTSTRLSVLSSLSFGSFKIILLSEEYVDRLYACGDIFTKCIHS